MDKRKGFMLRLFKGSRGAAAVEFAIILNILLLLVMGIAEFGHAFYMKQIIINASREGARYGVVYQSTSTGTRVAPSSLSPSIKTWVLQGSSNGGEFDLTSLLPANADPTVTVAGTGYSTGTAGTTLQVTVSATKEFWIINKFLPFLGQSMQLTASTVMRIE